MKYYVDFEFTHFIGDIISVAIVCETGEELYLALDQDELRAEARAGFIDTWVIKNVLPVIDVPGAVAGRIEAPRSNFKQKLTEHIYLFFKRTTGDRIQLEPIEIYCDWYEDAGHLLSLFVTGKGQGVNIPRLTINCNKVDSWSDMSIPGSEVEHNALCDARVLKRYYDRIGVS